MLTQLLHFVAIVDHGGLTRAAAVLNISQPALTRSLQALEFRLDVKLLTRTGGRRELTEAGKLLLSRAKSILAEQNSILEDLASLKSDVSSVAYVNGSPVVAMSLLPEAIIRLGQRYPQLRVSVRGDNGMNYAWKMEALKAGSLDVVVSIGMPLGPADNIVHEVLLEPELKIIASRESQVEDTGDLGDLSRRRWVLPPTGSSGRAVIDNEFRLRGLAPPTDTIEISDWRIALDVVEALDYLTALPYHPAAFGRLHRFRQLPVKFQVRPLAISIIYRPQSLQREPARRFIEVLKELVAEAEAADRTF